ncbi:tripartite tricarboxylate transporter TctB family protein [Metabacillus idriensis]|uniref:Tripartite tricarboxylate transporter TctB family protein n=1 Tax=Metabacillus idriensis TaxID=324768 RepID=A0A6I2MCN8_9BACI|nr:tripartite tricarboxylate transporter TctB family protein [Metabacillus idriensis]MCM3598311.1 tripartite tricarboxylate transporter TctB family protein [Metabacillus idriensis]MRX55067.1 tripartite tricarboxylate transporter TctB family protein [Metabacillus idriensis]OHR71586.1 transporter [Bacillus sp. HMSC76G11]
MSIHFDRAAAVLFLTVGALFMYGSMQIAESSYGSVVGPNIFPFFLGAILFLLSLRLFYETLHYQKKYGKKEPLQIKAFIIIFAATLLYIALLETIGYVITTFVFLFICFQAMERGQWVKSIVISACFSAGIYYLFVVVLKGTLPSFPVWF